MFLGIYFLMSDFYLNRQLRLESWHLKGALMKKVFVIFNQLHE